MFGQKKPKVFSISARDGLEAKLSQDSRRLAASGIPALEQELVSFLLTQKRSEFLLRMCDRVAELAHALPDSDGATTLAAEIALLSQRIAATRPDHIAQRIFGRDSCAGSDLRATSTLRNLRVDFVSLVGVRAPLPVRNCR